MEDVQEHVERAEICLSSGDVAATHRYVSAELGHTPLSHQYTGGNNSKVW